jgi:1-acyl-sn-glycerol-3-phosphate acyltransferase
MRVFLFIVACLFSFSNSLIAIFCVLIKRQWGQTFHHAFGRINLWIYGVTVSYQGLENIPASGGVILLPNHESIFDIFVLSSIPYDFAWVAKSEVGKIPFIAQHMKALGSFFVKRDGSPDDVNTMREIERVLRNGRSILIFPEGTRTRTGQLLPFKKGAFRTAQNAGVPLVPVAITGTRAIAKPGEFPLRGHRVTIRFGRPFPVAQGADLSEVMAAFRAELIALLAEDR